MPPKKTSSASPSHASRAAAILASARKASQSPTKAKSASTSSAAASNDPSLDSPIQLQQLMSHVSTSGQIPMRESMSLAAKLIKGKLNTVNKLSKLSPMTLDEAGIDSSSENGKKVLAAFRGRKAAGLKETSKKSSNFKDPFEIPSNSSSGRNSLRSEPRLDYVFNETLEEEALKGKFVMVNRSPVMCAWAMVVLERLGFKRSEALSLAQCYVSQASHSRGVSIGVISTDQAAKRKREHVVGQNQPHFELMGMKIPLMRLNMTNDVSAGNVVGIGDGASGEDDDGGEWRGIESGVVVGPERVSMTAGAAHTAMCRHIDRLPLSLQFGFRRNSCCHLKAFNYMKRSLAQTLPLLIGALSLLADSYINPLPSASSTLAQDSAKKEELVADEEIKEEDTEESLNSSSSSLEGAKHGPDFLNEIAYSLYCDFRPETGGQWGKKSRLEMDKILSLRRGKEADRQRAAAGESGRAGVKSEDERNGEDEFDFEGEAEALEMEREAERMLEEEKERDAKKIKVKEE